MSETKLDIYVEDREGAFWWTFDEPSAEDAHWNGPFATKDDAVKAGLNAIMSGAKKAAEEFFKGEVE